MMVLSISAGIYLYNKGPLNVRSARALPVNAEELYTLFSTDSALAGKKFTSSVLLVTGTVSNISSNTSHQEVVLIKTATDGAYVNCTLEEPFNGIEVNNIIKIKGICSGIGQGDAELGIPGDVYLTRCLVPDK